MTLRISSSIFTWQQRLENTMFVITSQNYENSPEKDAEIEVEIIIVCKTVTQYLLLRCVVVTGNVFY